MGDDDEGVGRGLSRLVGGLLVDELTNGAVLFSLIVVVAAVVTQDPAFVALGVAVGLAGMVLPLLGVSRKWADTSMSLLVAAVLIADVATLWVLWQLA